MLSRHRAEFFFVIVLVLTACGSASRAANQLPTTQPLVVVNTATTTAPHVTTTPTGPTATPSSAQIQTAIQKTLDHFGRAYTTNDEELLKLTIDKTNLPFRRLVVSRFEDDQRSVLDTRRRTYIVESVSPREQGFMLAHIIINGNFLVDWFFRQVDGTWVLSEPTVEQLGKPTKIEHDHFTFTTYSWTSDVNETVINIMEEARAQVNDRLGKTPTQRADVEIRPIYGLDKYFNTGYVAYYYPDKSDSGPDHIIIYAPHTYAFGGYDPTVGWEDELRTILKHEYTHMVHTRSFQGAGWKSEWMFEGLAEYISDGNTIHFIHSAVHSNKIIPIIDTKNPVYKQDLMHMTTLKADRDLAYGFAHSLVKYIVENYGGLDGFWKLAQAYDKSHDMKQAVSDTFGQPFDQFDAGWRAWLKEHFDSP